MKKHLALLVLLAFSGFVFAQEKDEPTTPDVAFATIEKVPVYPGCSGDNNDILKKCFSDRVSKFVATEFNTKEASKGLKSGTHRIYVNFLFDSDGNVTNIRSRAPNDALEKEAIRVIKKLPAMQAGKQKGKAVGVIYTLPITFKIDNDKKEKGN